MRNFTYTLLILFLFFNINNVFSQSKKIATKLQLQFLQNNFNWDSEDYLIIAYKNSENNCTQYKNEIETNDWVMRLVDNAGIKNAHEILVVNGQKSYANSKQIFMDKEAFILKEFLNTSSCFSLIVFNEQGHYISKIGEFTEFDIKKIVKQLKL